MEHHLLKKLFPGHTIIIDNASFHKSKPTRELVEKAQCQLVFLPPYSPDLNPLEKRWAHVKRKGRSIIKHVASLDPAINIVLSVH
ncbi:transposase [Thioploca ingrica]|uniref:Transposase n=1 Tax=Thioploca ingrica TaxID=40754 RepID=A0A090BVI5_9GAMM|nr:transposase [Thioploca ingrica]